MLPKSVLLVVVTLALAMVGVVLDAQSPSNGASKEPPAEAKSTEATAYQPRTFGETYFARGDAAYQVKDYSEAVFWYRKWTEAYPESPFTYYQMACCHAVMGQIPSALDAFETAVDAGWDEVEKTMTDSDLESIRSHDRFKAALARIPKSKPEAEMKKEEEDPFVKRRIVRTATLGTYLVYFPKNYDELERKEKASLQICVILHGHGGTELGYGELANDLGREKVIYVVPRAPYFDTDDSLASSTEGYTLYPPHLPDSRSQTMHPFVMFADFVRTCVDDTRSEYQLDKDKKIRVLGHSMGAAAALVFACRYSDMVESAFIYAGHLPGPELERFRDPSALGPRFDGGGIDKAKHVKFVVAHCKDDEVLDISESEAIIARLAESGITAEAKFLETGGHAFPPELLTVLAEWVKTPAADAKAADGK